MFCVFCCVTAECCLLQSKKGCNSEGQPGCIELKKIGMEKTGCKVENPNLTESVHLIPTEALRLLQTKAVTVTAALRELESKYNGNREIVGRPRFQEGCTCTLKDK